VYELSSIISLSRHDHDARANYVKSPMVDQLEYRLETLEWNGLKGIIGAHLARSYIRNKLARKIIDEERWTHVVLSNNDYKLHV
jgi:hypothetical protein